MYIREYGDCGVQSREEVSEMQFDEMGDKYLKRYKKHFRDPDIREFDMQHEQWLFGGDEYAIPVLKAIDEFMEQEYGDTEKAQEKQASYESLCIGTISMKNDFRTKYGDKVKKADMTQE